MVNYEDQVMNLKAALEELVAAVEDEVEEPDMDSPLAMAMDRAVEMLNIVDEDGEGFEEEE